MQNRGNRGQCSDPDFFVLMGDAPFDNVWPLVPEPTVERQREMGWVNGMRFIARLFTGGAMDYLGVFKALRAMALDPQNPLKGFDVDFWFTQPCFAGIGKQAGIADIDYIARGIELAGKINRELQRPCLLLHVAGELDSSSVWPYRLKTRAEAAAYWRVWNGNLHREVYAARAEKSPRPSAWSNFKNSTPDLFSFYRLKKRDIRRDPLYACCSRAWAVHQYYEWGLKAVVCEGNCYTPWSTQLQIAFLRGAARQYHGYWGMDYSPWGTAFGAVTGDITRGTTYSSNGYYSGISASLLLREWLAAFMSGARHVLQESSYHTHFLHDYAGTEKNGAGDFPDTSPEGQNARREYVKKISPVGKNAGVLADFALRRHGDRGRPYVPFGIILEHDHGWNSLAARRNEQGEDVGGALVPDSWPPVIWGGTIQPEPGDHMITNFFRAAFSAWPNFYWTPGRMGQRMRSHKQYYGAYWDQSDQAVIAALRNNILPIEQLEQDVYQGSSRWGDSFDVVLENCELEVLKDFRVLILLGRVKLTGALLKRIQQYVAAGGTLLANICQLEPDGAKWLGVTAAGTVRSAGQSRDLSPGSVFPEPPFSYTVCKADGAETIAETGAGDLLIGRIPMGRGEIFFSTAHYLQADDALAPEEEAMPSRLLQAGLRLMDRLYQKVRIVAIEGPPIESIVTLTEKSVKVTLINNYQTPWSGGLSWKKDASPLIVRHAAFDCWRDEVLPVTSQHGVHAVRLAIEPFGIRVVAIT